ncbi:ATP synthase subunit beta [Kordiimonas sediminis]|uniref:ATP synthase subunit beta n=1 Tax=Kordiimonas sediminis TaxID=1735581 RepID=A0A919APU2_9PROT|nr:SAM-dependent methyltransferase [Kordiimonas sediminis]GHF18889.1 ATP synthase subunit beta [Kordiimonas sediminis]
MTALKDIFLDRIRATGPIPLADYMAECLMHPKHGYYTRERVFGAEGDFITAPDVSQMFGEMLGLWCADRWMALGSPASFQLVELGPGRGTLMADILRAGKQVQGFTEAASVNFVEASPQLRDMQRKKVPHAAWHDNLAALDPLPTLFVANEFFDALPIHQFEKTKDGWRQRAITADNNNDLQWCLMPASSMAALIPSSLQQCPEGDVVEVCPAALSFTGQIARHIVGHGGAALFIDYGYSTSKPGDSFQALRQHNYTDPLLEPGKADLTAHVAFDQLQYAGKEAGAATFGPATQGQFLMALGLGLRAQALAKGKDLETQATLLSELKRLTAPEEMGELFKVIALQNKDIPAPPAL